MTERRGAVNGLRMWQYWRVRAIGAAGSALRSHRRGHRFESGIAHNPSWQAQAPTYRFDQRPGSAELRQHSRGKQYGIWRSIRDPGHTWLHHECSRAWHQERKAKAVAALVALGIAMPVKFADDFGKNGGA